MIIGVLGDTHDCQEEDIVAIVSEEFLPRKVDVIIHTGDIEKKHINPDLFAHLPVVCVLTKKQTPDFDFSFPPPNWIFVRASYAPDPPEFVGNFTDPLANKKIKQLIETWERYKIHCRLVPITHNQESIMAYCGHERSFDVFNNPQKVADFFNEVNQVYDGVRLATTGHTHHQFVYRHDGLIWVNPGSVVYSWNHTKEFAVVYTDNWEVVLGRLSKSEAKISPVTVGIVSDTGNIDDLDVNFWLRLSQEFNKRGVSKVICCGDFRPQDIGRPEFENFDVYYYLLAFYQDNNFKPNNWHLLSPTNPLVEIGGHRFYVQHEIGLEYADFSEIESNCAFKTIVNKYKHLDFIVAGLVPGTIFQETQKYAFINPGDARSHRCFATICLPRLEYTVSTIS